MPKLKQILTFLSIFALILGSSHFYMFTRLNYYLQLTGSQRFFFGSLLTIYSLLTLIHIPVSRILPRKAATLLAWAIYPCDTCCNRCGLVFLEICSLKSLTRTSVPSSILLWCCGIECYRNIGSNRFVEWIAFRES